MYRKFRGDNAKDIKQERKKKPNVKYDDDVMDVL